MSNFSIDYYLPPKTLDNEELSDIFGNWESGKILRKTGIRSRHIVVDETASDLAVKAVTNLFNTYDLNASTIEFVIVVTQSPDYILPTTACMLQDRIGLKKSVGALDINLGCSGYIYALSVARGLITSRASKNVLLITADTYSRYIHPLDKSTRTLFGDAATATFIDQQNIDDIMRFTFGTDGSKYDKLIVPASGFKMPKTDQTKLAVEDKDGYIRSLENLYMDGVGIFNFTLEIIEPLVYETLEKNQLSKEDIDLFVFHQANKFMLENVRQSLEIPRDKFYVNMEYVGNTVSSSIPIALKMAEVEGRLKKGMKVLVAGFGVGLSWGATILNF